MKILSGLGKLVAFFAVEAALIYALLESVFNGDYALQNIYDAMFVVGAVMLSIGLITLTNATKVFTGFRFAFKQMFSRKNNYTHMAYYDYQRKVESKKERVTGLYPLLTGLTLFLVSAIWGFMQVS
jgi:hypothetical protein